MSLTKVVIKHTNLIKPILRHRKVSERPFLELTGMKHPYIDCDNSFVANDTILGGVDVKGQNRPLFTVITGPNMVCS